MDLSQELRRQAASQDGVLAWHQLNRAGIHPSVAQREVRAGRWLRLRRGAYLVDMRPGRAESPWVQARAIALTHPGVVLAGSTAASLWGLGQAPAGTPDVVVPPRRPIGARRDLTPHAWVLRAGDVTTLRGMRVTTRLRTLLDLVCLHDRSDALAVLDAALRHGHASRADLSVLRQRAVGRHGAAAAVDLWELADGRAESGLESRVRLRCIDGGVPPDDLQVEIRSPGGALVARADMVVRRRSPGRSGLLLIEADGTGVHSAPAALYRDRGRANDVTASGHDMLRFTVADTIDPWTIPVAVRAAA